MTDQETEGKFKLDGNIEQSQASVEDDPNKKRQLRSKAFALLAALACALGLLFTWQSFQGLESRRKLVVMEAELHHARQKAMITDSLSQRLDSLSKHLARLQRDNELLIENSGRPEGVFFEVQIGSFSDFDLDNYLEQLANVRQEKYDGKTKLMLGRFRSFKKALLFENDLKRIGLKEAFIVGRIDGKLVPYKEALEAMQKEDMNTE